MAFARRLGQDVAPAVPGMQHPTPPCSAWPVPIAHPSIFFSSRRPMFPRLAERQTDGLRYRCRLTRRPTTPASAFYLRQCTSRPTTASRSGPLFTRRSEHNLQRRDGWPWMVCTCTHTYPICLFRPTIVISIWGSCCEIEVPRIAQTNPYADG